MARSDWYYRVEQLEDDDDGRERFRVWVHKAIPRALKKWVDACLFMWEKKMDPVVERGGMFGYPKHFVEPKPLFDNEAGRYLRQVVKSREGDFQARDGMAMRVRRMETRNRTMHVSRAMNFLSEMCREALRLELYRSFGCELPHVKNNGRLEQMLADITDAVYIFHGYEPPNQWPGEFGREIHLYDDKSDH
jgi:hypothetical protein